MSQQPPIYVINMAKDTARMASMAQQLAAQGLEFERVEAVVGREITQEQRRAVYSGFWFWIFHGRAATINELGCTLSHRKVWQLILDRKQDYGLIFEDDVVLQTDFSSMLNPILVETPTFEMLQLYSFNAPKRFAESRLPRPFKIGLYGGSHASAAAYFMRNAGAQKLLKGGRVWINADKWVWASALYGLKCCSIYPFLVEPHSELSVDSSIGEGRNNALIYRWTLLPVLRTVRFLIMKLRGV